MGPRGQTRSPHPGVPAAAGGGGRPRSARPASCSTANGRLSPRGSRCLPPGTFFSDWTVVRLWCSSDVENLLVSLCLWLKPVHRGCDKHAHWKPTWTLDPAQGNQGPHLTGGLFQYQAAYRV
uniref:Uncharacterized protein n=1 Tax=Pipistrellus kuhlii TaxID=59472 RepID=A0A7J7UGD2_PIPKU|nr:hypothetical protein mPipKuh1_009120 [Pipistrellus kuhlii]